MTRLRSEITRIGALSPLLALAFSAATLRATELPFWSEPHEVTDLEVSDQLRAHGVWLDASEISCTGSVCTFVLTPYRFLNNDPAKPLCPDLEVFSRPHGGSFFGGVLVGSDLFLTVHQADPAFCANRKVVFGFGAESAASVLLAPLAPGQALEWQVPAGDVYDCDQILAGANTVGWTLARLDRPVTHRRPVKLWRAGSLVAGDSTVTAGYPNRLPLKLETAPLYAVGGAYSINTAHILGGSSGSMVLAPSNRLLGVVPSGETFWWTGAEGCYRPDPSVPTFAYFELPLAADLGLVPALGLDVSLPGFPSDPLAIDHYGPPGGPFQRETLPHRLAAGLAGLPVDWSIDLPLGNVLFAPAPGEPTSGHLEPGAQLDLVVVATPEAFGAAVGLHESWLNFSDPAYGTHDTERHRLHVGVDGFDVACVPATPGARCEEPFLGAGPSGALEGETQIYRLTSRWLVAQTVTVTAPSWASMSGPGGWGNPLSFVLGPSAQADVTVSVIGDGSSGTVEDEIRFQSSHASQPMHQVERLIRGDLGRVVIDRFPGLTLYPGDTVEIPIHLRAPDIPLDDVDLCIQLDPTPGLGGNDRAYPPSFRLFSPLGTEVKLGEDSGRVCFSDETFTPPAFIRVHQSPDMVDLEGEPLGGIWTLVVEVPALVGWEKADLEWVSLRLRPEAGP